MIDPHRLQKLEETIAHQDRQINDLSDMLILQGREIKALRAEIVKLGGKIDTIQDNLDDGAAAPLSITEEAARNKPPHY